MPDLTSMSLVGQLNLIFVPSFFFSVFVHSFVYSSQCNDIVLRCPLLSDTSMRSSSNIYAMVRPIQSMPIDKSRSFSDLPNENYMWTLHSPFARLSILASDTLPSKCKPELKVKMAPFFFWAQPYSAMNHNRCGVQVIVPNDLKDLGLRIHVYRTPLWQ